MYLTFHISYILKKGTDPKPEDIQKFYKDNLVPLVGQMFKYNERKRYTEKRPLCVAYYDVDFGFDNRVGKCLAHCDHTWIEGG